MLAMNMGRYNIGSKHRFASFTCIILAIVSFLTLTFQLNSGRKNIQVQNAFDKSDGHPYGVIGILSADKNVKLRNIHRKLFANYKTSNVKIYFLLNKPTKETTTESSSYTDIIFINSSYSGKAVRFGEKFAKWFKLSMELFPDAQFVGKMDDDVYICDPSFRVVWENVSPLMYLGWSLNMEMKYVTVFNKVDDMFVILGKELVQRISERKYCFDLNNCESKKELYDKHWGAPTIGVWLSIYDDVITVPINNIVIFKAKVSFKPGLCDRYFLLHCIKDPDVMDKIYQDSKYRLNVPSKNIIGVSGTTFNGKKTRTYFGPSLSMSVTPYILRDNVTCTLWGVVTTIHSLGNAISNAANKMCLVIVADIKTPQNVYKNVTSHFFIKFLSVNEQKMMTIQGLELTKHIPWNHFGRKNIGYVYAIMHGAESIFDFDDDNILIRNFSIPDEWYVSPKGNVYNPYSAFSSNENIPWPRGFPLGEIRNFATCAGIKNMTKEHVQPSKIGVIQSLAKVGPDVDAIWRLTRIEQIKFHDKLQIILQAGTLAPFNSQATMFSALWGLLLPMTVHGRVSDIWRSYLTQRLMWDIGETIGFVSPCVEHVRNAHNIKADFNSEIPLYEQTDALVDVLQRWRGKSDTLEQRMVELYIELYERNILEYSDVANAIAWIRTLKQIKYKFPTL